MINLRYHIVSITAVFLALAIGVVMGTSFLGKATVDQLKTQIGKAERRSDATEQVNARLTAEIKRLVERENAMRQQGPQLLAERLSGEPVLIIASAGVDRESLASLQSSLEATAAEFKGTLFVAGKLRLEGDDLTKMSDLLGLVSTERSRVRRTLTERVARMLIAAGRPGSEDGTPSFRSTTTTATTSFPSTIPSTPSPFTTAAPPRATTTTTTPIPVERPQPTLLTDLRAGGWLSFQPPADGSKNDLLLTTPGYRYVIVSGPDATVPDTQFLRPLVLDLAQSGPTPAVVASAAVAPDPETNRTVTVGPIRKDDVTKKNVSTVDDLESFDGDAAVVLALEELVEVHGHYGVGDGASSLLPPPP